MIENSLHGKQRVAKEICVYNTGHGSFVLQMRILYTLALNPSDRKVFADLYLPT